MSRRKDLEGQMSLFDIGLSAEESAVKKNTPERNAEVCAYAAGSFPECKDCWCYTCEHSTVGGSHPRPFAGGEKPCSSCEFCVGEGHADICVIGSAKEGCSFRAEKESIISP